MRNETSYKKWSMYRYSSVRLVQYSAKKLHMTEKKNYHVHHREPQLLVAIRNKRYCQKEL